MITLQTNHSPQWIQILALMTAVMMLVFNPALPAAAQNNTVLKDKVALQSIAQQSQWQALSDQSQSSPLSTAKLSTESNFPESQWWTVFNDQTLNQLIEEALRGNPDLKTMDARIQEAEALAKVVRSGQFPQLSAGANYVLQQYGKREFLFPLEDRTFNVFQVPLSASYELDFWGKNRLKTQSAKTQIKVTQYSYQNATLQLTAAVASAYFNTVRLAQQQQQQRALLGHYQRWLTHQKALVQNGVAAEDTVDTVQQLYSAAMAESEILASAYTVSRNQLALLRGRTPAQAETFAEIGLIQVQIPETVATGVASELVTHRPDVMEAEARLKAAAIDVQVARREFLPQITLNARTGFSAIGLKNLFRWDSLSSIVNPGINQPLFTGGALRGNLNVQKARYEQLLYQYQSTLLNAFTDVENALTLLKAGTEVLQDVSDQTEALERKVTHAKARWKVGIDSELPWIASDIQRLEFEKVLTYQKSQVLIDHIGLAKALGGGFNETDPPISP